jgi:hypothetical protein
MFYHFKPTSFIRRTETFVQKKADTTFSNALHNLYFRMYEIQIPHFVASRTSWGHTHPIQNLWSSTRIKNFLELYLHSMSSECGTPFIIIHGGTASRNQRLQCAPWLSVIACGVVFFTSKCSDRYFTARTLGQPHCVSTLRHFSWSCSNIYLNISLWGIPGLTPLLTAITLHSGKQTC